MTASVVIFKAIFDLFHGYLRDNFLISVSFFNQQKQIFISLEGQMCSNAWKLVCFVQMFVKRGKPCYS